MDFSPVAGINGWQLADKSFDRHAGTWKHITCISVRHFNSEPQRDFLDFSRLYGTVKRHIHIRPGIIPVWAVRGLLDLSDGELTGKELERRLDEVYITANKNTIPNEQRSPFITSGVRLGTPAVTTRGLKEADMDVIAECIHLCATDFDNKADAIRAKVTELLSKYPLYND